MVLYARSVVRDRATSMATFSIALSHYDDVTIICNMAVCSIASSSQQQSKIHSSILLAVFEGWVNLTSTREFSSQSSNDMSSVITMYVPEDDHYNDVIMSAMASWIISLTIVYSTVYSVADYKRYQSPASLAFVRGIHRWPVNSSHKGPVTRKMFPFDDVIMQRQPICFQTFYTKWTTCCLLIDRPLTLRLSWKSHGCLMILGSETTNII